MGGILLIETTLVPGGKGKLVMTGSLGEVISESAELALTVVRSRAASLGLLQNGRDDLLKDIDVHVSLPPILPALSVADSSSISRLVQSRKTDQVQVLVWSLLLSACSLGEACQLPRPSLARSPFAELCKWPNHAAAALRLTPAHPSEVSKRKF